MQQARDFLARVLPWPTAGATGNYMNIHYSVVGDDGKPYWRGFACTTLDDMVSKTKWLAGLPDTIGVYACMSSQRTADLKQSRKGNTYYSAVRSLPNAVEHKSFYADIDVKEKGYATTQEAIAAFSKFLTETKLPSPTAVVATGSGGFHVHWTIGQPVSSEIWKSYAQALANAIQQHGLFADTQCTVDAARILRIPDTFNKKSGSPVPVTLMCPVGGADYANDVIFNALQPYLSPAPAAGTLPPAFANAPVSNVIPLDTLGAGIHREARPVYIEEVAKECPFIADALATGGKDYPEPLWNLTTLIATFTEGKHEDAHAMAEGHAEYTRQSTNDKYNRKLIDRQKGIGWPQCSAIANAGCTFCQTCKHKDEGKSPLNFGHATGAMANLMGVPTGDLPPGYIRQPSGHIDREKVSEDGTQVLHRVAPHPMTNAWVQTKPHTLYFHTDTNNDNKKRTIEVPFPMLAGGLDLHKCLLAQAFTIQVNEVKTLGNFLMAWVQELQRAKDKVLLSSPFGWLDEDGKTLGFTFTGKTFMPGGERPAALADTQLAQQYQPSGTLDAWKKAAKLITDQKRPALDTIIACSFAAPLIKFTGLRGATVSAYSQESGVGKTSAMQVASAVWGDPILTTQATDDTHNSVMNKVGEIKHLPLFWDELKTEEDINKIVKLAFQITSGKDKSRMTAEVKQRHVGKWETLAIIASNDTLTNEVTKTSQETAAGVYRLFEFAVTPGTIGQISTSEASRIVGATSGNYGHAGAIYAKFLGENHEAVQAQVGRVITGVEQKCKGAPEERFWFICAGTIMAGAMYACKLGLVDIDLSELGKFLIETIEGMRKVREAHTTDVTKAINIENTLAQYMASQAAFHTLKTEQMVLTAGRMRQNFQPIGDDSKLQSVHVHIATKAGIIRFAETPLRDWLRQRKLNAPTFFEKLEKQFAFRRLIGAYIAAGTRHVSPFKQYCIEVHFAGTALQEFVDSYNPQPKEIENEIA